jgi:hypothetical protein
MNGAPAVWVGFYVWATRPPAANAHLSDDETKDVFGFCRWEGKTVRAARMPTEAHPTSKLAGTPISDDETVAKMGHPRYGWALCMGHPPEFLLVINGASRMRVSFHV